MPFVPWDQAMCLGIEEIDDQHRGLVDILNRLHDERDRGADVVRTTVADMGRYAEEHFSYEEERMAGQGYPDLASHRSVHQRFREQVAEFARGLELGVVDVDDVLDYLKQWLVSHIMRVDREFARFLGRC